MVLESGVSEMDRTWRIGDDLVTRDSLLDGITFDDLILAVHCNCKKVNRAAVHAMLNEIMAQRRQDMAFLLENNMDIIIEKALEGRQQE